MQVIAWTYMTYTIVLDKIGKYTYPVIYFANPWKNILYFILQSIVLAINMLSLIPYNRDQFLKIRTDWH